MAVAPGYPKEMREDRTGGADNAQYKYARRFQVILTDTSDGPNVALQASGIPRVGDVHPYVAFASVTNLRVDADDSSPLVFYVSADYATPPRSGNSGDDNPNPLLRPAQYSWGFATQSEPVAFGKYVNKIKVLRDGTEQTMSSSFASIAKYPMLNSARQPPDPLPERQASYPMVRVTKNISAFSAADAVNYVDHVNADTFGVAGNLALPGQALMASITADRQFENNVFFWQITYEIHYRKGGWTILSLDKGTKERKLIAPVGGGAAKWKMVPIVDASNLPGGVALLDGNGNRLPQYETEAASDVLAVYHQYKQYEEAIFSTLLL